jgi:hypothetical protein
MFEMKLSVLSFMGNVAVPSVDRSAERLAMTYSMDALVPGFYVWVGRLTVRWGGSEAEENYSGMIHQPIGMAIVLPGYRIFSTYQGRSFLEPHKLEESRE